MEVTSQSSSFDNHVSVKHNMSMSCSIKVPSHGATFGSTCFATSCTTKRLRSTIQHNFTGYDDLRVLSYVAAVATPKQWIPSINVSTDVHYA